MSEKPELYKTCDLYLSAYLKLEGNKMGIEKNKNKITFVFEKTEKLELQIMDYLNEKGQCSPLLYTNSIKNLKNLIYNL
jgi:hypothetical protein